MSGLKPFDSDGLRPVEHACTPDPRHSMFFVFNKGRSIQLEDYHQEISVCALADHVPKDIRVQFDVVRNLYLYAWFVYRFFPVAEFQAMACLELALRERCGNEIKANNPKRKRLPNLQELLKYSIEKKYVRNEGFARWHRAVEQNAKQRFENDKVREMLAQGLTEFEIDDSNVEVTDADRSWDLVGSLVKIIPMKRNIYAHGSKSLHYQVFGTIKLVSEIINQLFQDSDRTSDG